MARDEQARSSNGDRAAKTVSGHQENVQNPTNEDASNETILVQDMSGRDGQTSAEQLSKAPGLKIDTHPAALDSQATLPSEYSLRQNRESPAPIDLDSSEPATAASHSQTPRSRARGFSLRKSMLARNAKGSEMQRGNEMELQATKSPQPYEPLPSSGIGSASNKQAGTNIAYAELRDELALQAQSTKSTDASISLPTYEQWLRERSGHRGPLALLSDFQHAARRVILGIRDIPPSKDGRRIDLDLTRVKPLVDERRGEEYIDNTIRSSRYSLWNFLPRQLFAQFSKLANFYFLCVSILQLIPGLSTTGSYTTIIPLLFFVSISIAKEGYDDLRRYRLDQAENLTTSTVLRLPAFADPDINDVRGSSETEPTTEGSMKWVETKWKDMRVGDIVKLKRDDAVPADMILLQAAGTEEVAYVETMALDGETNLKSKQPPSCLGSDCTSDRDLFRCDANFVVEDPNLDLYKLDGKVTLGKRTVPLTNNEVLYRGSILRNTHRAIGMVIYSGEECKIRMNSTKNPRIKAPALQSVVNKVVVIIVFFVIALAIFNTAAYHVWRRTYERHAWYLKNATVAFFPILTSFIILFNTMIPLSLYVSLEIVKLFQILFMNDVEMYDAASNTPLEARTSTINEELGQVSYIFSDKTGTLTNNTMKFRKISVAGTAWLHNSDLKLDAINESADLSGARDMKSKGKRPVRRRSGRPTSEIPLSPLSPISLASPASKNEFAPSKWTPSAATQGSPAVLGTEELLLFVQSRPHTLFARKVQFFLLSLSICHTCFPETRSDGRIDYQAASPDEQALVQAAQELGYIVTDRNSGSITVKTYPSGHGSDAVSETYQILDVIEFSSARKRMSIIVRMPNQRICVFCKGADSTIMQLLRLSDLALAKTTEIERKVEKRQSLEAQEVVRRNSEAQSRRNSSGILGLSIPRTSLSGLGSPTTTIRRLQPIRDEVDQWISERESEVVISPLDTESVFSSSRLSGQFGKLPHHSSFDRPNSASIDETNDGIEETLMMDDETVFERCFQQINDFATEGLRTLLYAYRYLDQDEYDTWKKIYLDASTSLVDRQDKIEEAGCMIEVNLELAGATAIEDKLQDGVPETIDKLRRAKIKLWMLTGDKRETAINIGHSCRLIKDYSTINILDIENGSLSKRIAAATLDINSGPIAHSVVVVDGKTLGHIMGSEPLRELFLTLAVLVDTVICCRASPSQKAYLVQSIRRNVNNAITLAIGDGANDIAMIQEAHVGIGITGKEGLQAARCSDYSIAQFRFLAKLLLVHGRWNYIRTCKYTLSTFWKETLFYLTQALFQRYAGYTGTSLYESWSLSMFNTLFTSLPVIFMGIFEKDLRASTLMAVPELYSTLGPKRRGFNIPLYLSWIALAASDAMIIFFLMVALFGQSLFTDGKDLFSMGDLSFTACIIVIATKIQFWELHNKTYTCAIAMGLSVGGWFTWNLILASVYTNNVIYDVRGGFTQRFGRNALWWLTLILCVAACWVLEVAVKSIKTTWFPSDADCFRELEKDDAIRLRFEQAAAMNGGQSSQQWNPADELHAARSVGEEQQRESEVQDLLDRPRSMRGSSSVSTEQEPEPSRKIRRRQTTDLDENSNDPPKVSFAAEEIQRELEDDDDDYEEDVQAKGRRPGKRSSMDVRNILKNTFTIRRRTSDIV